MIETGLSDTSENALEDLAPDLTPMLDILFILLVFFMLTAGAVFQTLELELPSSVSETLDLADNPRQVVLEIRTEGFALDGKPYSEISHLRAALPDTMKRAQGRELIIASDKLVAVDRLLRVMTALEAEGIRSANILMLNETQQ